MMMLYFVAFFVMSYFAISIKLMLLVILMLVFKASIFLLILCKFGEQDTRYL